MPNRNRPAAIAEPVTAAAKRVDRLADPEDATEALGEVDTTRPLEARGNGAPLVPARDLDRHVGAHVATIARLAELRRAEDARHARKATDLEFAIALAGHAANATTQLGADDRVSDDLAAVIGNEVRAWLQGRGANEGGETP